MIILIVLALIAVAILIVYSIAYRMYVVFHGKPDSGYLDFSLSDIKSEDYNEKSN